LFFETRGAYNRIHIILLTNKKKHATKNNIYPRGKIMKEFKMIRESRKDTIGYDSVYLTCSKKLMGSQLSLPHGINKKLKCETKNKLMSVIGPVQSHYH